MSFSVRIYAQLTGAGLPYDTVWLSLPHVSSMVGGEACYVLVEGPGKVVAQDIPAQIARQRQLPHGSINYEYYYRSRIDNPFLQQDFQQHSVSGRLFTKVLKDLPVNINFRYKVSNSPYFRNTLDIDVGYDIDAFRQELKNKLLAQARSQLERHAGIGMLEKKYREAISNANYWQRLYQDPEFSSLRRLAAQGLAKKVADELLPADTLPEKNKAVAVLRDFLNGKKVPDLETALAGQANRPKDSVRSVLHKYGAEMKEFKELGEIGDKEAAEAKSLYQRLQSAKKNVNDSLNMFKSKVAGIKNGRELDRLMERSGISKDSLTRTQRRLAGLRSLRIGRSMPDYSELTVRNVSVTGISAAVSAGPYISVAAGFMDYSYRDLTLRGAKAPRQMALMARAGLSGYSDRGFFITGYTSKREVSSPVGNSGRKQYPVSGYSLQYIWRAAEGHMVSAEVAKSGAPDYTYGGGKQGGLLDFGSRGNEAYQISYEGRFSAMGTRVSALYKRMGSDFQCLSGYRNSSGQTSYKVSAEQALFNRTLNIRGGIQKNSYNYPYLRGLSANSVFKTAQLTFRKKGWPTLMAGYYPVSQLVMMPGDEAAEMVYHTFSAMASHQYRLFGVSANTTATATRFYNSSADSGFVYQNTAGLNVRQMVWVSPLTFQAGYALSRRRQFSATTYDLGLGWSSRSGWSLSLGGGLNTVTAGTSLLTGNIRARMPAGKVGEFHLAAERSSIPSWQAQGLIPVNGGRLTYIKNF